MGVRVAGMGGRCLSRASTFRAKAGVLKLRSEPGLTLTWLDLTWLDLKNGMSVALIRFSRQKGCWTGVRIGPAWLLINGSDSWWFGLGSFCLVFEKGGVGGGGVYWWSTDEKEGVRWWKVKKWREKKNKNNKTRIKKVVNENENENENENQISAFDKLFCLLGKLMGWSHSWNSFPPPVFNFDF